MITIPEAKKKTREQLEKDIKEFLDGGGSIEEVISDEKRSKKEKLVKTYLFFSVHHPFYARETGISVPRLKAIQRTVSSASDEELETLWVYFRKREWGIDD